MYGSATFVIKIVIKGISNMYLKGYLVCEVAS